MNEQNYNKIGVDWGSSGFRAYLFDDQVQLIDSMSSADGIKTVESQQFETTLFQLIGHWITPGTQILLSGMITSRNGWIETPYIPIPAKLNGFLNGARRHQARGIELIFLPGLSQRQPRADVIRGEELQLIGATLNLPTALVVMPGTHSKWAQITDGTVSRFQTIMTGELFDVLLNQTLVGQLAQSNKFNEQAYLQGVQRGYESKTLISELFHCRSGILLNELDATAVHSYLSGLLIGNELSEGMTINNATQQKDTIVLVGSDELCMRYAAAFEMLKIDYEVSDTATTSNAFAALLAET